MKKLITLTIITLFFISCSNDDNPIDQVNKEKSLIKMIQTRFNKGKVNEKIIFTYKNNKPIKFSFYSKDDEPTGYTDFLYNTNQLLASTKTFLPDGTLQSESHLTYDNKNRLIQEDRSENGGNYITANKFTHNNDNTITVNSKSGTTNRTKTFHINNNGLIYKETVGDKTNIEIIYDGNNPTSMITKYSTTTYTYDEVNLPKNSFLNNNTYGDNKINPILAGYYLEDQVGSSADKFEIKAVSSNGDVEEQKYTFDSDGYPVKMKRYYNNELNDEIEYFYE